MDGGHVVPSANRGLKGVGVLGASGGESPVAALIDFLVFSAKLEALGGPHKHMEEVRRDAGQGEDSAQFILASWLVGSLAPSLIVERERRGFRNFYEHHYRVLTPDGEQCGFFAVGGERQRGTVCVELTGSGCAHVTAWAQARDVLEGIGAKLSRVDVAHDDYAGRFGLEDARAWHAAGLFNSNGRPPALNEQGWDDGSGRTLYIGKNVGNQQLCVYEKGRQQGARDGDAQASWIRWEGRFGAKYRAIPLDVLTSPAAYLIGHFPPLASWISAQMTRMRTSAERAAANLDSAVRFAKRQCGALFNLVRKQVPDPVEFAGWITRHVVRDRSPAWLRANPFAADSIAFSFSG